LIVKYKKEKESNNLEKSNKERRESRMMNKDMRRIMR